MTALDLRSGETVVDLPAKADAGLYFIGRIETPWKERQDCPRQGRLDGPLCTIAVFDPWGAGLERLEEYRHIEVLYWLDRSRRDIIRQSPKDNGVARGAFSLRSPVRPNPIATQIVKLEGIEGNRLSVRGLDCLDGTPLIDLKPDKCEFSPQAPPKSVI